MRVRHKFYFLTNSIFLLMGLCLTCKECGENERRNSI